MFSGTIQAKVCHQQSPQHEQYAVHTWPDLTQSQSSIHSSLQQQYDNSKQARVASSMAIHSGWYVPLSYSQPHLVGDGRTASGDRQVRQTYPAWKTARLVCKTNASLVGGMKSKSFPFLTNICILASSTCKQPSHLLLTVGLPCRLPSLPLEVGSSNPARGSGGTL